jgi:pyrroloquinoline quinone biosynthesis protein B
LGGSAGGGFPQWNSNSEACRRARAGDPAARPLTQASIAVSSDGERWFLINASPDLREQIHACRHLHPRDGLRSSPIAGVILTNGDVDAVAGLLHLRERTAFRIFAHPRILAVLDGNPIFRVLAAEAVSRQALGNGETMALTGPEGYDSGLRVTTFPVQGKVALYMEDRSKGANFGTQEGDTVGLEIVHEGHQGRLVFIANCVAVDPALRARCAGADLLFFDGTLWRDGEMVARGEGTKTGGRMGHISMSGPEGSIAALADLEIGKRLFIHINNINPALLADSPERRELEVAGWRVAEDGLELRLP